MNFKQHSKDVASPGMSCGLLVLNGFVFQYLVLIMVMVLA
jgi:hypothetical protein